MMTGTGFRPPPPSIPRMPYPNMYPPPMSQPQAPFYNPPPYGAYPRHYPPVRTSRRCSRRCRPVVEIIRSDSCSSISTCSTISPCSRRRYRSCSCPRYCETSQPQQPVILLPIQCQQQPQANASSTQGQSVIAVPSTSSSMIQPSTSMPQIAPVGKPQQFIAGPIQYIRTVPQVSSSSQLQPITVQSHSTIASQPIFVSATKTIPQVITTCRIPQNDLKFGRRPFDWYPNNGTNQIVKDEIRIGQQGQTLIP